MYTCIILYNNYNNYSNNYTPIDPLCSKGEQGLLWDLAKRRVAATDTYHSGPRKTNLDHLVDHAISLAQDGMYAKASHILVSAGLAPNNDSTWQMLQAKHPKGPLSSFNTAEV